MFEFPLKNLMIVVVEAFVLVFTLKQIEVKFLKHVPFTWKLLYL